MRTVPRKYPGAWRKGDRLASCFYCGGTYYLHKMRKDAGGNLRCPERSCRDGRELCDIDPGARDVLDGMVVVTGGSSSSVPVAEDDVPSATWSLTAPRYFAVDGSLGNDANAGFSDASMAAAGAVAVATLAQLRTILPVHGAGRMAVVAVKAGTYAEDLNLSGLTGYRFLLVRGTSDFTNSAADKIISGGVNAIAGPNGDGSFTCAGGATTLIFTASAGSLGATDAIVGKRIRFTSATTTAALRNFCTNVNANTGTQVTAGNVLPATPVAGDTFVIEQPGVVLASVAAICANPGGSHGPISVDNDPTSQQDRPGVMLVGLATTTAAVSPAKAFHLSNESVGLSFCETRGETSTVTNHSVAIHGCYSAYVSGAWQDEGAASVQSGTGLRTLGNVFVASVVNLVLNEVAIMNTGGSIIPTGGFSKIVHVGAFQIGGGGSYFAEGLRLEAYANGAYQSTGVPLNTFGSAPNYGASKTRVKGFWGLLVYFGSVKIAGVQSEGTDNAFAVVGGGNRLSFWSCSTTGTNAKFLDASLAVNCEFLFGNLVTGTGTTHDIFETNGLSIATADVSAQTPPIVRMRTGRGNVYGPMVAGASNVSLPISDVITMQNATGGNVAVGEALRAGTSGGASPSTALAAQGDSAANAKFLGIALGRARTAAATNDGIPVARHGYAWALFDGAPTQGAIAYLSTGTAKQLTTTVPVVAATNQKLRVGRVISTSGNYGLVALSPEALAVAADGAA